jgi:hypothetical protein
LDSEAPQPPEEAAGALSLPQPPEALGAAAALLGALSLAPHPEDPDEEEASLPHPEEDEEFTFLTGDFEVVFFEESSPHPEELLVVASPQPPELVALSSPQPDMFSFSQVRLSD